MKLQKKNIFMDHSMRKFNKILLIGGKIIEKIEAWENKVLTRLKKSMKPTK